MTNLTKYQEVEIAEIVEDAIAVTPLHYQSSLTQSFQYLAFLTVKEKCGWHLADIQLLIDMAKADNVLALESMTRKLNSEISQLSSEMRSSFEKVAQVLQVIDDRQNAIERRVELLEQQPHQPTVIVNNTHQSTVPKELIIIAALTTLVGLLVLQQSMNVRDTWYLQNRQEVRR